MSARTERSPDEIARQCRVDRVVDWWVTEQNHPISMRSLTARRPAYTWTESDWDIADACAGSRTTDSPPDAAMREAVIREIDAIAGNLERRRTA